MKLSVAMATYNGEAFLRAQLQSLLSQTRLPDEVVVCDDCSRDATMEILEAFALEAPFDVLIARNEQTRGFVRSFEQALGQCSGGGILLSDQDDVWSPDKLSVIEKVFAEDPRVMVFIHDQLSLIQASRRPEIHCMPIIWQLASPRIGLQPAAAQRFVPSYVQFLSLFPLKRHRTTYGSIA